MTLQPKVFPDRFMFCFYYIAKRNVREFCFKDILREARQGMFMNSAEIFLVTHASYLIYIH